MKIGVVGKKMGENSFGCTLPYLEYMMQFGDEISILTPNEVREDLDLLILPGGADVATTRYASGMPSFYNGNSDVLLEHFDKFSLPRYIEMNTPIVGICRGFQSLVVHFGGTLDQNISHPYSEKSRGELVHGVEFTKDAIDMGMRAAGNKKVHKVNSLHHQGAYTAMMPSVLKPLMLHDEAIYGERIVEAFIHESLPIVGFQFHPEETYDHYAYWLISYILEMKNSKEVKQEKESE